MKPKLPLVNYEVTMNCNLKCRFCYNHHKNTGITPPPSSYKQADKTLRKIFKVFDVGQVTFTGGEPFCAERFGELVLTARLKGAKAAVISNGNYATIDKYLQLVDLGIELFELPIHSHNPEIHDTMTRIKGSHQKSVSIIKALKQKKISPTVVLVLTKFNAETAGETIKFISTLGINRMMLNRYNIGGEGVTNPREILPDQKQLKKAFSEISAQALQNKISVFSSVCTPHCILNPRDYNGIRFSSCSFDITKRPVTIDYLGNIRFCNHSPIILGNIYKNNPKDIINNPESKKWEEIIPNKCQNCKEYPICKAGCRAASQQCGLTLNEPDPIIKLYQQ